MIWSIRAAASPAEKTYGDIRQCSRSGGALQARLTYDRKENAPVRYAQGTYYDPSGVKAQAHEYGGDDPTKNTRSVQVYFEVVVGDRRRVWR